MQRTLTPNQVKINALIGDALIALKNKDFAAYIRILTELGADVAQELELTDPLGHTTTRALKERLKGFNAEKFNFISRTLIDDTNKKQKADEDKLTKENLREIRLHAELFLSAWTTKNKPKPKKPEGAKNEEEEDLTEEQLAARAQAEDDNRSHAAKDELNKSTRQQIFLGMLPILSVLDPHKNRTKAKIEVVSAEDRKATLAQINKSLGEIDDQIHNAIKNYQTTRQRWLGHLGRVVAGVMSFTFGMVETGAAVFGIAMLFHPVGLALYGVLALALLLGAAATYTNYQGFKDAVPNMFNYVAGKDKPFQGFLEYKDETTGKHEKFNKKQVAALTAFSVLFAAPTGLVIGALGYTSVLFYAKIALLFGLSVSASAFPPIAIVLLSFVAVSITFFVINYFYKFLKNNEGSLKKLLSQPFNTLNKMIDVEYKPKDNPYLNPIVKGVAYAITALWCGIATVGLCVAAKLGANSLQAFLVTSLKASPSVALTVGFIFGTVVSGLSRAISTFTVAATAPVNIIRAIIGKKPENAQQTNKLAVVSAVIETVSTAAFYFFSLIHPTSGAPQPIPTAAALTAATVARDGSFVSFAFEMQNLGEKTARQKRTEGTIDQASKSRKGQPQLLEEVEVVPESVSEPAKAAAKAGDQEAIEPAKAPAQLAQAKTKITKESLITSTVGFFYHNAETAPVPPAPVVAQEEKKEMRGRLLLET